MLSFTQLYDQSADDLYFLCTRLEVDEQYCDLLFQDAWRRVHQSLSQGEGHSEELWLYRKLAESHRRLNRGFTGGRSAVRSSSASEESRLSDALMALGLEYRWPLVLREYAGLGYAEIASVVGVPEGTVRARMGRARALLQKFREEGA